MAPTTPPFINPSLRTNRGDDGAAGALARATSAEKREGSRGPKGPKVSNNFGPVPTRRNPARGAKVDGGLAEAEVAGGTPRKKPPGQSPRKKPRGEKTFLLRLDREKEATEQGRKEFIGLVEGRADDGRPKEALPKTTKPPPVTQEDNKDDLDTEEEESDDEASEDASDDAKRPACRNLDRKAKLGSIADERTEGGRPKKSYEDDEELTSEDEANFEADRAYGAAGDAAVRRWTDDVAVRARAALAWEPRDPPQANVMRPDQPYDVAARALAALRDDEPYQNPKLVQDRDDEEPNDGDVDDDEDAGRPHPQVPTALFGPSAVSGAAPIGKTQGKTGQSVSAANFYLPPSVNGSNSADGDAREGEARSQPPQVPAALFDSTAGFGSAASGKTQGRTGQGVSAADFSSWGRQNDEESLDHDVRWSGAGGATNPPVDDEGYSMADASNPNHNPGGYVIEADRRAMRDLADSRSFRGTSANRMAADVRAAEAAPGWTGAGADYAAWLRDLREDPANPEAAITDRAPERAYLVVMNGGAYMSVIHHLFRWKAPDGGRSRLDGRIVAFEGEVLDAHGLPRLWRFDEEEEKLLQLRPLSVEALGYAAKFYQHGDRDDEFHNRQTLPLGGRGATVQTCQRLIPIPVGWAFMFLDNPPMGVAYRRMLQLVSSLADTPAARRLFRAFGDGVALACGSPNVTAPNPISAADSKWKRVAFGKATLSVATAAWEGHRLTRLGAPKPPPKDRPHQLRRPIWRASEGGGRQSILGGQLGAHHTRHATHRRPHGGTSTRSSRTGCGTRRSGPGCALIHHPQGPGGRPIGPVQCQPRESHCIPDCNGSGSGGQRGR